MVLPEPDEKLEPEEQKLDLEPGSMAVTLEDVYMMFYILVAQNQRQHPGAQLSFDLNVFTTLPNKLGIAFEQRNGRLFAWIPEKQKDRKKKKSPSRLSLPDNRIITQI